MLDDPASYIDNQADADLLAEEIILRDYHALTREAAAYREAFEEAVKAVRDFKWQLDNGVDEYTAIDRMIRAVEDLAARHPQTHGL